jgi:hypothetical protein
MKIKTKVKAGIAFLQVEGLEGDVTTADHEKWIEC